MGRYPFRTLFEFMRDWRRFKIVLPVPEDVKEAARAFGATEWQVLRGVELPLARPSILAGINHTVLMCLSIASLLCAMVIDRIVQGCFRDRR